MGVVYLAHDDQVGRLVALKVLSAELASSEEFRARFAREMRIAVKLEHPHVVPVYETGELDGQMFIAMRFVDGEDLRRVIGREGALAPERTARIALMLGSALNAAHAMGLVHRDVKPANVLLTGAGPDEQAFRPTSASLARRCRTLA